MRNTATVMLIASLLICGFSFGQDQKTIEAALTSKLQGGLLVLRSPYTGRTIKFDLNGNSKNDPGIRGFDDKFQVNSVELRKDRLVLKGVRLHDIYDPQKKIVSLAPVGEQIEVQIALTNPGEERAVAVDFYRAVLSNADLAKRSCSEFGYLEKLYEVAVRDVNTLDVSKQKAPEHKISEVCFPSGSRGFRLAPEPGITLPKAIKDKDPDYPDQERIAREQGGAAFAIRVDESGRITDGVILRANTIGFVRNSTSKFNTWRFKPGLKEGVPVPSVFMIEVNFHMTR